ncbi:hypothetical protein K440DRAFT_665260 [Wilcoxina mikolae CBS 423.85]|nr:hypothetical protein K440DRAFT_665260 [Wilcoxina mikolae CBS 423.85]
MTYILLFTLPQLTELLHLYFRSHYLPLPFHHEFQEWVNYTFEVTAKEHRAAAKYHPDSESLLKAGAATVRTVLKRGEKEGGWMVSTKTTTPMRGTAGKSYERRTWVSTAIAGSETVRNPLSTSTLAVKMTYAEVTASPPQRSTSVAPPGTRTPYALNCTSIKVPLKPPGPSTPLQAKPLTLPVRTPLAPTPAQRNRDTTPAHKSYAEAAASPSPPRLSVPRPPTPTHTTRNRHTTNGPSVSAPLKPGSLGPLPLGLPRRRTATPRRPGAYRGGQGKENEIKGWGRKL